MTTDDPVAAARTALSEALQDSGSERQAAAVETLFALLTLLQTIPASISRPAMTQAAARGGGGINLLDESAAVRTLIPGLSRNIHQRFHLLLRLLHPRWINGGEAMMSRSAPPFEAVKDDLMAALDCGVIDFEGFAAVLIGRYGPDASSVLPELVLRLRRDRKNCSKAPGLTWAVYMIGGVSAAVREVLLEVATNKDSCPHSRPLAIEILKMNEIPVD